MGVWHTLIRRVAPPSPAGGRRDSPPLQPAGEGWGERLHRPGRQASREPPCVVRPLGTLAAEGLEPAREIDRVAAEPALGQYDRNLARRPRVAIARGVDDHARQTRRQREA